MQLLGASAVVPAVRVIPCCRCQRPTCQTWARRLTEWLLGVEAHCRAAHELDAAAAWAWPRQLVARQAEEPAAAAAAAAAEQPLAVEQGPEALGATAGNLAASAGGFAAPVASLPAGGEDKKGGAAGVQRWPAAAAAALEMRAALGRMLAARRAEAMARCAWVSLVTDLHVLKVEPHASLKGLLPVISHGQ